MPFVIIFLFCLMKKIYIIDLKRYCCLICFRFSKIIKTSKFSKKRRFNSADEQRILLQQFYNNLEDVAFLGNSLDDENDLNFSLEDDSGNSFDGNETDMMKTQ